MELTGLQVDKVDRLTMSIYGVNRSTGLQGRQVLGLGLGRRSVAAQMDRAFR